MMDYPADTIPGTDEYADRMFTALSRAIDMAAHLHQPQTEFDLRVLRADHLRGNEDVAAAMTRLGLVSRG